MLSSANPTPCPRPRHTQARSSLAPLLEDSNAGPHYHPILLDTKPRRPKKQRRSVGWDPTVDIYHDDTFAFKNASGPSQSSHPPSGRETGNQILAKPHDRRSTLFAQPAQRPPLETARGSNEHDGHIKRRRITTILDEDAEPAHESSDAPHADGAVHTHEQTLEIRKEPRRRTIYVPSEDTTIMTIHPGASLHSGNARLRRPRRSDVFLDLAALSEEKNDCPKSNDYCQLEDKRKTRMSLAAAPRRAPLQSTARPPQPESFSRDIAGNGSGKENVPPSGTFYVEKKDNQVPTLKRAARRSSIMPIPKADIRFNSPKARRASQAKPPVALNASDAHPSTIFTRLAPRSQPKRPSVESGTDTQKAKARTSLMLPQPRTVSALEVVSHASRDPRLERPPVQMSVPLIAQSGRFRNSLYPILQEDFQKPELYEDNWISHQEAAITELINNLLERSGGNSVSKSDAEGSLTKQLLNRYQDSKTVLLHKRLQASLRFGALSISKESLAQVSRVRDDLQLRQRFLDLWVKTYNLQALQTAVEVIIGREVTPPLRLSSSPLQTSSPRSPRLRQRALEAYLKTFLIRNEDGLSARVPHNPPCSDFMSDSNDDAGSPSWMWRRTVVRSLMIVLLLDKAQKAGILHGCLFQPASPFKSSSAVVQALGTLLLPSIGNILRVLDHLNYHIGHIQYPLEEQSFHIENLAVDLRDGVVLTRLLETLLYPPSASDAQRQEVTVSLPSDEMPNSVFDIVHCEKNWVLSQHLKYPCISRVQKLYNVQIALSALSAVKDFAPLISHIKADDIVDGHREKTVGLLWSIVGRWGLGTLLDFDMVEREIRRLDNAWKLVPKTTRLGGDIPGHDAEDEDPELPYLVGLERYTHLLQNWARKAARLHGVLISNLSTAFADREAYKAIAAEYSSCLKYNPAISEKSQTPASAIRSVEGNVRSTSSLTNILHGFGCSRAFISLFQNTSTMPSSQTTIPLLAFLASRFLPAAEPHFAAVAIQRAWKLSQARLRFRRRLRLAVLASECRTIVLARERMVAAAVKLQRWWRRVEAL